MAPSTGLDPLGVVVKVVEVVSVNLLKKLFRRTEYCRGSSSFTKCHLRLFCSICLVTGAVRASASLVVTSMVMEMCHRYAW